MRILITFAALSVLGLPPMCLRVNSQVSTHGTINILLANNNGMALVTDSRASDQSGRKVNDATQKLFQIDSTTVCSIAGFGADPGPIVQLKTSAGGEILAIADGLAQSHEKFSFQKKVLILASGLASSLDELETAYQLMKKPRPPTQDQLVVLCAGFDVGASAEIARAEISVSAILSGDSKIELRGKITDFKIYPVNKDLVYLTSGVDDSAKLRLRYPQGFADEIGLKDYVQAMRDGHTADLSLDQMEELARYLESDASRTESVIGGPAQVARLENNQVQMNLPGNLIRETRPYTRIIIEHVSMHGLGMWFGIRTLPHTVFLDADCDHSAIKIDDSIFIGGKYEGCVFYFDGGDVYRDPSVVIEGGTLILGPHALPNNYYFDHARTLFPELTLRSYRDLPENVRKNVWPDD